MIKILPLTLVLVILGASLGYAQDKSPRTVVDMAGRTVVLPAQVDRVACISGPSYEKVFLLGEGKKVVLKNQGASSAGWALATNPGLKSIAVVSNAKDPNIEELLQAQVQVVFFWDYPAALAKLEKAGLTVVVTQISQGNPDSVPAFLEFQKREVRLFGAVLGGQAVAKADQWCQEFDERVRYVTSRTASLKVRPPVYFIGGSPLAVFSRNSYPQWWIQMAGGQLVSGQTATEMNATVSMEEVLRWNPEFIFTGRMTSMAPILDAPAWAPVKAVSEKKVFLVPDGIMFWDYGSEGVLLLQFLAQKLNPGLFTDLNLAAEVKKYYREFYGVTLADDQVGRILSHQGPVTP